ncbi:MAG: L-histidine N(alpha)-methyltransferase [Candidatus Velthaea sp.]
MISTALTASSERFALYRDPHPARVASFAEDVRAGLGSRPYRLSAKYLYDDLGSSLFEAICRLPEYYLTRVERDLLATYAREIIASFAGPLELVELGSGSALKTKTIIEAILERQAALTFHPIDISPEALVESSLGLIAAHDTLRISAYASDYFALLRERRMKTRDRVLALYLGSNVGNFEPADARSLLELLAHALKPGDGLLMGYDLKKDAAILEAAYDDPTGVTSAFNKNLLGRINRELGANFDLDAFTFRATYDDIRGAVDSYLVSNRRRTVDIPTSGISVPLSVGETIHTESSYKFTRAEIVALAQRCGYAERKTFTDAAGRYALSLLTVT